MFLPVARGWARIESYYDGTLDLDRVWHMLEMADVLDENERMRAAWMRDRR